MRIFRDTFDALAADVPRETVRLVPRTGMASHTNERHANHAHANHAHANDPISGDPSANDDTVLIALTVDTASLAQVRRTLHATLGATLGVYIATIDRRTGRTCLQVEVGVALAPQTLRAIRQALPQAEFGAIRSTHRTDGVRSRA